MRPQTVQEYFALREQEPYSEQVLEISCDNCDSNGWVEGAPYGYDPRDGGLLHHYDRCTWCDGTHRLAEPVVLVDEDDDYFLTDDA